jgi:hypothetical protein
VDREFVTLFMIFDETSPYLDANIQKFTGMPDSVAKDNEEFKESNKKHAINGLLYGNLKCPRYPSWRSCPLVCDRPWQ